MIVFTREILVDSVLTDADSTPTISIIRTDTHATVVATTSTGITHDSTGNYSYSFTGSAGVTYRATWTLVILGDTFTSSSDSTEAGSSATDSPSNPQSSLTIDDMLGYLVDGARNAGISDGSEVADGAVYTLAEKRRAIFGILNHFIRATKCSRQIDVVALTAGEEGVDLSAIANFDATRVLDAAVVVSDDYSALDVVKGINFVEPAEARAQRARCGALTATPWLIEVSQRSENSTASFGKAFPTPKASGQVQIAWSPLMRTLAGNTIIPILDDLAITAVRTGGVCWLQNGQLENIVITDSRWQDYLAHVNTHRGRGSTVKSFVRAIPRRPRGPVWPEIVRRP